MTLIKLLRLCQNQKRMYQSNGLIKFCLAILNLNMSNIHTKSYRDVSSKIAMLSTSFIGISIIVDLVQIKLTIKGEASCSIVARNSLSIWLRFDRVDNLCLIHQSNLLDFVDHYLSTKKFHFHRRHF